MEQCVNTATNPFFKRSECSEFFPESPCPVCHSDVKEAVTCIGCKLSCCRSCTKLDYMEPSASEPYEVCLKCVMRSGIAVMEPFPSACYKTKKISFSKPILWGVYVLRGAAELPNRCILPHGSLSYDKECLECRAPVVPLKAHVPRRVIEGKIDPSMREEIDECLKKRQCRVEDEAKEEENNILRSTIPFDVLGEDASEVYFANVAANLCYEYNRCLAASQLYMDIPYACCLSLVTSNDRYSIFERKGKPVKYVAFPGTRDVASFLASVNFSPDWWCTEVHKAGLLQSSQTWKYLVHGGFAREARRMELCFSQLLEWMEEGQKIVLCGHSLGGAVAMLLTLVLLEKYQNKKNASEPEESLFNNSVPPVLCITFGAPLVGEEKMWECVKANGWSSCFHHVVRYGDPVASLLVKEAFLLARSLLKGGANKLGGLLGGLASLISKESSSINSSSADNEKLSETPTDFNFYTCGRYHFLQFENQMNYISFDDPCSVISTMRVMKDGGLRNHYLEGYNEGLMWHQELLALEKPRLDLD